jgi:hypothetical protein
VARITARRRPRPLHQPVLLAMSTNREQCAGMRRLPGQAGDLTFSPAAGYRTIACLMVDSSDLTSSLLGQATAG